MAQEVVHNMNESKGKKDFFSLKVDLAKDYNKLSCEFIWRTLEDIKVSTKIMNIIMHVITSVETNIK